MGIVSINLNCALREMSHLQTFCPILYVIVVFTHVLSLKVGECHWLPWVNPHLSKHPSVNVTHQHLTNYVEAVSCA